MPGIGVPPSVPPGGPTYGDQGSPTGIAPAPANNGGTGNAMNAAPVVPTGSWDTASAVMTDSDGKQTSVKARTFYYCGSTYLTLGGQQVKFETMQRFDITSPTNPADATITLLDGQRLTGVVDASCDYYGDNDIGRVDVGAKSLKSVEFRRNGY
jgi:serine/threonine-protein kinase